MPSGRMKDKRLIDDMYQNDASNKNIIQNYSRCTKCPLTPNLHFSQSARGPIIKRCFFGVGSFGDESIGVACGLTLELSANATLV